MNLFNTHRWHVNLHVKILLKIFAIFSGLSLYFSFDCIRFPLVKIVIGSQIDKNVKRNGKNCKSKSLAGFFCSVIVCLSQWFLEFRAHILFCHLVFGSFVALFIFFFLSIIVFFAACFSFSMILNYELRICGFVFESFCHLHRFINIDI